MKDETCGDNYDEVVPVTRPRSHGDRAIVIIMNRLIGQKCNHNPPLSFCLSLSSSSTYHHRSDYNSKQLNFPAVFVVIFVVVVDFSSCVSFSLYLLISSIGVRSEHISLLGACTPLELFTCCLFVFRLSMCRRRCGLLQHK